MITVTFTNIGRYKKTWSQQLATASHGSLVAAIKEKGALLSNDIDFTWNEAGTQATVFAGIRPVGTVELEAAATLRIEL